MLQSLKRARQPTPELCQRRATVQARQREDGVGTGQPVEHGARRRDRDVAALACTAILSEGTATFSQGRCHGVRTDSSTMVVSAGRRRPYQRRIAWPAAARRFSAAEYVMGGQGREWPVETA